jgi:hypothetical protein
MTGRPFDDPSVRVARLVQARKQFKPREICNMRALATAAGVTSVRMSQEVKQDPLFPVVFRGSEGVEWEFEARKAIDHLLKQARSRLADRERNIEKLVALAGIRVDPKLMPTTMSLAELREVDRLQAQAQKRKIEQGEYVPAVEHRQVIGIIFDMVRETFLSVATEVDSSGLWPSEISGEVSDHLRNKAVEFQARVAIQLENRGVQDKRHRRASS